MDVSSPQGHDANKEPWRLPLAALRLEQQQGYQDRAVIGGLAELVRLWAMRAGPYVEAFPELQQALVHAKKQARQYKQMKLAQRQAFVAWLEELGHSLAKALAGNNAAATSASPKQRQRQTKGANTTAKAIRPLGWNAPLRYLRGVGPARASALAEAGLHTIGELLQYYPFRYEDRRDLLPVKNLQHRQQACVYVQINGTGHVEQRGKQKIALVPATDGMDSLELIFFNQPYRAEQFALGSKVVATGQARIYRDKISFIVSEIEIIKEETLAIGRLVPVYHAPPLSQMMMRRLIHEALGACREYPEGRVPAHIIQQRGLMPLAQAFKEIHFPQSEETLAAARQRLAYDELFFLQVRLAQRRRMAKTAAASAAVEVGNLLAEIQRILPFALTKAQIRVINEIFQDLRSPEVANRLIHGDVGSGKTIVAAAALLAAVRAGKQAALMAPTELLAEQHAHTLKEILSPWNIQPLLLTGSISMAQRQALQQRLAAGEALLVVGTHALFQKGVHFADLAVIVIDEQHRFGVRQRAALIQKGQRPNTFIMSATPIPRTLALTAYGDFDVSLLDELPPGRKPVHTELLTRREAKRAYRMISEIVQRGRQAYLVCPLIKENEAQSLAAAEAVYQHFQQEIFPGFRLGLLHGQMEAAEREKIMEHFRAGLLDVLVATTVIEVGVNVPNAICIVVLNAERFGLAQLHQLRGRVARGSEQGYCLLVTNAHNPDVIERLQILEHTHDGFRIAEEDLWRRGPGELAGRRQSGLPDLRMANLLGDTHLLSEARQDAFALIARDPELTHEAHHILRQWLQQPVEENWAL